MPTYDFIYLASQSPRRRELLTQIGVRHTLLLPAHDEDTEALEAVLPSEIPADYVQRVTRAKLHAALIRYERAGLPVAPILCADTTVTAGGVIYGKPQNKTDACRMLAALQGGVHFVLTAVAVALPNEAQAVKGMQNSKGAQEDLMLSTSQVTLAPMSGQEIAAYVASGESLGKAGAYAIQGRMAAYVCRIEGSYSGIMGLPLYETALLLGRAGVARY